MSKKKQNYLKKIPAVNDLLGTDKGEELINLYSHNLVVEGIRKVIDELRTEILETDLRQLALTEFEIDTGKILADIENYLGDKTRGKLISAVNATGVVIHTNLGRSVLCESAQKRLQQLAAGYSTLEIDRKSGKRGSRSKPVEDLLTKLTGAEAGLVVNNNAAAVLLALSTLCKDKEAVIARSQLVEIGGSFRIPEVMKESGAKLVEVGTTNRVHLADYRRAINEETGILLKVHPSNYKIMGFRKEVSLEELVNLGKEVDLPVVEDLGSGSLVDLTSWGLSYEPTVQDSIKAGVDIVTFSGDKLLGGPQAGIIVGKKEYIEKMKENQLTRALRVDKLTLGALETTLQEYCNLDKPEEAIPTLNMLNLKLKELKEEAEELAAGLQAVVGPEFEVEVREEISRVGGGALPGEELFTYVVELFHCELGADEIAEKLRLNAPPIFTRISNGAVLIDVRTLQEEDPGYIINAVKSLSKRGEENEEEFNHWDGRPC